MLNDDLMWRAKQLSILQSGIDPASTAVESRELPLPQGAYEVMASSE